MSNLSIVIITKNEGQNLERCLKQLSWCNDIVIVDDFSDDRTVEIAKNYTDRIFLRKFDHFSSQRNYGVAQAKHQWILSLDPDEEVSSELREEIMDVLANPQCAAYAIPFKHHFFGKWLKHGGWWPSYLKRLFHKHKACWGNEVHELLQVKGPVGKLSSPMIHYSHRDIAMFIEKMNKYTEIEADVRVREGKKDSLLTMFGVSLKVFLNRYIRMKGFLDGVHGLVVAMLLGVYKFVLHAKSWEKQYKKKHRWTFEYDQKPVREDVKE